MVVSIFGCTGFVGRYVANKFGKIGSQLIFPYRADHYEALRLRLNGDLGQTLFHFYDIRDMQSIKTAIKYSNVVVNLVGRDWETKNFKFDDVHVQGARNIARFVVEYTCRTISIKQQIVFLFRACREMGVEKLIHMSALNATPNPESIFIKGGSKYLASKYHGELAVRDEFPDATIIRPADIYGQEDRFLRYYAHVWRRQFRSMPLWYKGERTIKQPVAVSDVAQAIVNAAKDPDSAGKVYQAVGPRRYLLSELVDWFHREMRKDEKQWQYSRYDLRYDPSFLLKVAITELVSPGFPVGNLHMERVEREYVTDVVEEGVPTLEDLGVNLTYMEDQVFIQ